MAPQNDVIPVGLCQCGCGKPTKPAPKTSVSRGWIKGKPTKYLRGHGPQHRAGFEAAKRGLIWCYSCEQELSPESFPDRPRRRLGRKDCCLRCSAVYAREWRRKNPERHRRNNESSVIRALYGITRDDYYKMLAEQDGVCAICRQPERRTLKGKVCRLAIDHCHASKKVRGLLCSDCNRAIGLLRDDIERLRSAIEYLGRHRGE